MLYNFDAEINLLEGKMKWSVVYFPHSVIDVFGTNGKVPVAITVDGHKFDHTLLPSRNGHYIVYNKIISQKVGKKRGESVQITLRKLEGKRKVEIPDYVKEKLLKSDAAIYNYMDKTATQKLIYEHLKGERNRRLFVWSLLNFEQWSCLYEG